MTMTTTAQKKALIKIIILGDSGVGKTAILHRYVMNKFLEEHKATIGADFLTKEITVDDIAITLQIWDTAGQERFRALGNAFYRGADACVLVYDISAKDSFDHIHQWRDDFLNQAAPETPQKYPFLLLGNKCDVSNRNVTAQEGKRYANDNNMVFYETSAVRDINIDMAMSDISAIASSMDSVPFFSAAVEREINLQQILDDEAEDGDNTVGDSSCACLLL